MMASRAMVLVRGGATVFGTTTTQRKPTSTNALWLRRETRNRFSVKSSLEPPNVARLAETARISLTQQEVEEFGPKIQQVVDWFGQLQAIDLESIEPALRADTEGGNLRQDEPEEFDNRQGLISGIPKYEEPYIKVPKVLNKK